MDAHARPVSFDPHDPHNLQREYGHLNLAELLAARNRHHKELLGYTNVVGTAVGLYLIRDSDPWPPRRTPANRGPRTLTNSGVRPYSWPCILAFVEKWEDAADLKSHQLIPNSLDYDDDRRVPVCVVLAPAAVLTPPNPRPVVFSPHLIGGGYPLIARVQGREHVASIGCLMTDGHTTYALTNRHVAGNAGEVVYTRTGSETRRIGVSSDKQLERIPFSEVYPEWKVKDTDLHLDVGLVEVDDVSQWTAQVYGMGSLGAVSQWGTGTLSLRIIGAPVIAYGCASGVMQGAVKALFYRYAVSANRDLVSDFLIGARDRKSHFATHPGDSGTLWLLDQGGSGNRVALAVQWGGQLFCDAGGTQSSCALATCLSTVCNLLEVDIVRDWNIGGPDYWGETGHYTIGALACTLAFTGLPKLQELLSNNIDRIDFKENDLKNNEKVLRGKAHYTFVPLADVADDVWRTTRPSDGNNHFADMDQAALSGQFKGKTLLQITQDSANVDPQVWANFYATLPKTNPGALPFRTWQIYNEMVAYASQGDGLSFLCAAGCLAHYVGDACQPLHVSRFHHGIPPVKKGSVAYQVHSVYETTMLNTYASQIVSGIAGNVNNQKISSTFSGGKGAAERVIELTPADARYLQNDSACGPRRRLQQGNVTERSARSPVGRLWKQNHSGHVRGLPVSGRHLGQRVEGRPGRSEYPRLQARACRSRGSRGPLPRPSVPAFRRPDTAGEDPHRYRRSEFRIRCDTRWPSVTRQEEYPTEAPQEENSRQRSQKKEIAESLISPKFCDWTAKTRYRTQSEKGKP